MYRIGYAQTATQEEQEHLTKTFEEGMRELGYLEGRNAGYERRFAGGKQERLRDLAAELVRLNVDVIVTGSKPVIAAVKRATATIPVVMAASRGPVASAVIASLYRPGGNIMAVSSDAGSGIAGKHLQLLKEAAPRASPVALLRNPLPPGAQTCRKEIENAARALGVSLHVVEARGRSEFEDPFAAMAQERADAAVVHPDPSISAASQTLAVAGGFLGAGHLPIHSRTSTGTSVSCA